MAATLPPIPKLVFCFLEPISLVAGAVAPFIDTSYFVTAQLPDMPLRVLSDPERVLAFQLGNLYMLIALIGIFVLNTTTESRVVRGFIWACWIADIGHVGATALVMQGPDLMDIGNWNAMAWGNIGATTALFIVRSLYLAGFLGSDKSGKGKRKAA